MSDRFHSATRDGPALPWMYTMLEACKSRSASGGRSSVLQRRNGRAVTLVRVRSSYVRSRVRQDGSSLSRRRTAVIAMRLMKGVSLSLYRGSRRRGMRRPMHRGVGSVLNSGWTLMARLGEVT